MNCNYLAILFTFFACFVASCDLINPAEPIPARIQLEPINFIAEPGQGTSRHKITEIWTYANSNLVGAFNPPVEIHYITDQDNADFHFRAGIRNNGILDDAIIYPMYKVYEMEINTTPGFLSEVSPVIRYVDDVVFSLISDFEGQNDFVDNRDTVAASMLVRSANEPFEGNYSGEIILNSEANFIEVAHAIGLSDLPTNGKAAYLEFHYKSEIEMNIGILGIPLNGQSYPIYIYLLKPSDQWNKIYLELTDWLVASDLPAYKILFNAAYPPGAPEPSYKIQIDNVQVLHLPE